MKFYNIPEIIYNENGVVTSPKVAEKLASKPGKTRTFTYSIPTTLARINNTTNQSKMLWNPGILPDHMREYEVLQYRDNAEYPGDRITVGYVNGKVLQPSVRLKRMPELQKGGVFDTFDFNNIYGNSHDQIKALQRELGVKDDGIIGRQTISALQKRVGTTADGIWGKNSIAAANAYKGNPNNFKHVSGQESGELYRSATKHAGVDTAMTLLNHLIPGTKKARMTENVKDQVAVLLDHNRNKINTVDDLDAIGEHGSEERSKKLSRIDYTHENELAGYGKSGVNAGGLEGNATRTVLGQFGVAKDKNGNYLIDDEYNNDVYRIERDKIDSLPDDVKSKLKYYTNDAEPNVYVFKSDQFDNLRNLKLISKSPRWNLAKTLVKDFVFNNTPYAGMPASERLRRYGENAIVETGKSTAFDFKMSDQEVKDRISRLRRKNS